MHELDISRHFIEILLSECEEKNITSPKSVKVLLGQLTTYKADPIIFYFDQFKKDTILKGTVLDIKEVPGKLRCLECKKEFTIDDPYDMFCTRCQSPNIEILEGKEFLIQSIEVR